MGQISVYFLFYLVSDFMEFVCVTLSVWGTRSEKSGGVKLGVKIRGSVRSAGNGRERKWDWQERQRGRDAPPGRR